MKKMNLLRLVVVGFLMLGVASAEGEAPAEEPPPSGYKLDWYGYATVQASPYIMNLRNLCDGDLGSSAKHSKGPEVGGTIEFMFPEPVEVVALRLMQDWMLADSFELRADLVGNGRYDTPVGKVEHEEPVKNKWISLPVGREVHGLKLSALSGKAGYRAPYPMYKEIEIYTASKIRAPKTKLASARRSLRHGNTVVTPKLDEKRIEFTPCIDVWMAGLDYEGKRLPDNLEEYKGFQSLLSKLSDIDATGVRIFLEGNCCQNRMPWKSKICPNIGKDLLKALIDALHKHGHKSYIFLHAWISPFQSEGKMAPMPWRRWDYPYEQSDLVLSKGLDEHYKERYPCVICETDFRDKWLGIMKEVVALGIDGVYVMPDEYYFKGHNLAVVKCPACEREFKKRYGYDSLPKPISAIGSVYTGKGQRKVEIGEDKGELTEKDLEQYRKWELFEYEKLAELFNDIAGELKKLKPELELISCANPASPLYSNHRMEHGIALDVIGRGKNFTGVQCYASVPLGLGKYAALARRMEGSHFGAQRVGSIQTLEFKDGPADFPIKFHGYLLPFVMTGSTRVEAYRLNYMESNGWWPHVKKGVRMMRVLEDWGIAQSRTPAKTCVLMSRASEDWWNVKALSLMADPGADPSRSFLLFGEESLVRTASPDERQRELSYECFRGMYAGKCVEGLLIENGIQYDLRYTERPDTLEELSRYKLLILPFSYSMSRAAFQAIQKAVGSGTKLLIYDQLGPTDEYGVDHETPLLRSLLGRGNVVHVKTNLAREGMDRGVREENRQRIIELLADSGYSFNSNGAKVEYLLREVDPQNLIVYLANWERGRSASPVLGLPVPNGRYRLIVCSNKSPGLNEGLVKGLLKSRATVGAKALSRLGVDLAPGEVKLIRIQPTE